MLIMACLLGFFFFKYSIAECNETLCGPYIVECKELCDCSTDFCYCCPPCLLCLDNGTKWFDCCDCFGLC